MDSPGAQTFQYAIADGRVAGYLPAAEAGSRSRCSRRTEETVGWTTFGCGARRFGVRGQAKRDPALARSVWGSGPPKRRRRCALPGRQNCRLGRALAGKHSKGPACRLSSGLLCIAAGRRREACATLCPSPAPAAEKTGCELRRSALVCRRVPPEFPERQNTILRNLCAPRRFSGPRLSRAAAGCKRDAFGKIPRPFVGSRVLRVR